ncbi:unnamed protein product, partial [Amoebophrya sp. A120]
VDYQGIKPIADLLKETIVSRNSFLTAAERKMLSQHSSSFVFPTNIKPVGVQQLFRRQNFFDALFAKRRHFLADNYPVHGARIHASVAMGDSSVLKVLLQTGRLARTSLASWNMEPNVHLKPNAMIPLLGSMYNSVQIEKGSSYHGHSVLHTSFVLYPTNLLAKFPYSVAPTERRELVWNGE